MNNTNDSRANELITKHEAMKATRGTWEGHWQECAEYMMPWQASFTGKRSDGSRQNQRIFDSTACLAVERFAAAMSSMLTPRNQRWHKLKPPEDLAENAEVMRYCEQVTDILFRARRAPSANFDNNYHETWMSLGVFGTGGVFVADDLGRGLRYQAIHLAELYIAESYSGIIDWVHREYELTAHQAMQEFGEAALPEAVRKIHQKNPMQKIPFLHCVKPNEERIGTSRNYRGMPFSSYHIVMEGKAVVREGGYRTFPYPVSRYTKSPQEVYGRGPAMIALADVRTLNEQEKTILRTGQRAAAPPLLMHGDGVMGFQMGPDKLNPGTLSVDGKPLVVPLQTGANLPLSLELSDQRRRAINDTFLVTLFQILVESPRMTATEVLQRAQEKGELLAPTMGRQQTELLGPTVHREIDVLAHAGLLPPMPDALMERGGEYEIEYDGPLSNLEHAGEANGILRTFETLVPLLQVDPKAMRRINIDECTKKLARANGVPATCLYTDEEVAEIEAQQQQEQAVAAGAQAALPASQAALNIAKAQQIAEAPVPIG